MPELPEVENMARALSVYEGESIIKITLSDKNLRQIVDRELLPTINNLKILKVKRIAKYVVIELEQDKVLIFHAGMSGRFVLEHTWCENFDKHDHVRVFCSNNNLIKYNDPRRFGLFLISDENNYKELSIFKNVAMDALDDSFNAIYLQNKLKSISSNIKNTLLNQKLVSGIGNIYASEALFSSKISPLRACNNLNIAELTLLVEVIKKILLKAIAAGGSTLKDYRKPNGEAGAFQDNFCVYNRASELCVADDCSDMILKITQNGRSSFYCPACQK